MGQSGQYTVCFLGSVFRVRLGAGCFDALIQSSTLQNNWPAVEQGPLFWQPLPAVSQHITLPLGGQKGARSPFSDQGNSLFKTLTKCYSKHGVLSLVSVSMMDRDKGSSVRMRKLIRSHRCWSCDFQTWFKCAGVQVMSQHNTSAISFHWDYMLLKEINYYATGVYKA